MRPLENFPCVRLEHEPLANSALPDIEKRPKFGPQFSQQVMFVQLRFGINIMLGKLQRAKVFLQILVCGVPVDEETDHERGVEKFAEPLLFKDIITGAKYVARIHFLAQQKLQTLWRRAYELQVYLIWTQKFLQRLKRGK